MAASSPNLSLIPRETLALAIEALLKWIAKQPKHQKSQLFEADDIIYLILTLNRIPPKGRTNPYRIPIPHPIHPFDPQSTSICIFLDDRPSSPLLPSAALDLIRSRNLPISSVIGLSDLKSDYRPYESRRKLCDSYDLFFADRKIIPLLPRLIGKHFFKRKKIPLAVDFSRVGWAEQIRSWCESSLLYLRTGTCSGLKIGRVTQSKDEILENALAVIERAMELVPRKWKNLRSLHVKTVDSLALPVYQAVPEIGLKIEAVGSDEDGGFVKGNKRVRGDEEKNLKERIHEVGETDGDVEAGGEEEIVGEEVSAEKRVKKKLKKDKNAGDNLGGEKRRNKQKKGLESRKEEDGDDVVLNDYEEEEENDELVVKEIKKKKKGKKNIKLKEGKRGGDEEDDGEENGGNKLSAKEIVKKKKEKKEEAGLVVADGMKKKIKAKKLGDKYDKKSKKSKVRRGLIDE